MADHALAIMVLEHKAKEYQTIAFNGKYRYSDPEEEIAQWERMAAKCTAGAEALKAI